MACGSSQRALHPEMVGSGALILGETLLRLLLRRGSLAEAGEPIMNHQQASLLGIER